MECGVEYCHLGHCRESSIYCLDAEEVCRIVERSQIAALLNHLKNLIVDDAGIKELHAAMQHPMADGLDFTQVLDDSHLRVGHLGADRRQCLAVLGDVQGFLDLLAVGLVGQLRPLHANAFHKPFAENRLVGHVKEGELEGRTARIDD